MQFEILVRDNEYALIDVTYYYPGMPPKFTGHPDTWEPGEGEEIEYEVLDLQGNPAPHLIEFIDEDEIFDKLYKCIEEDEADAAIAAYEDKYDLDPFLRA